MATMKDYLRLKEENKELRNKLRETKRRIKEVYDCIKNGYSKREGQKQMKLI